MASYNTGVYREQGRDSLIVDASGVIDVKTGGVIKANGTQASNITAASESHSLNATFSNTEAQDALDALGGTINAIIAALEGVGITASS